MAEPIEEWIDEALVADVIWMRQSRSIVFVSPSRDQVRSMIEAAAPLIAARAVADERERVSGLALAVRQSCACGSCKSFLADLIGDRP